VLVPVALVGGVTVPVVEVVDVVVVGDSDMPAALPVSVIVARVLLVDLGGALVDMPIVSSVEVPVVDVVDVVAVRNGDMTAAVTVNVRVVGVHDVGGGHGCSSWECLMAS
jgi:hypothetical protein